MTSQKELSNVVKLACDNVKKKLQDSPISLRLQIANHVGFYQGFCAAKGWDIDSGFLAGCEKIEE